jgi:hypothetical protein
MDDQGDDHGNVVEDGGDWWLKFCTETITRTKKFLSLISFSLSRFSLLTLFSHSKSQTFIISSNPNKFKPNAK